MCCLSKENIKSVTTDADVLRSEIRDKSVRVIDVRREEDYKKNHIPTSVNMPLANLLSDDSPERVVKLVNNLGIDDERVSSDCLFFLNISIIFTSVKYFNDFFAIDRCKAFIAISYN